VILGAKALKLSTGFPFYTPCSRVHFSVALGMGALSLGGPSLYPGKNGYSPVQRISHILLIYYHIDIIGATIFQRLQHFRKRLQPPFNYFSRYLM
jgi:hypothetical protein